MPAESFGDLPDRRVRRAYASTGAWLRLIEEVDHAVTIGRDTGGHRRPDERRDRRLNRLQRPGCPTFDQRLEVRDATVVGELLDEIPVRAVDREDRDASGDAARAAPQLRTFVREQRFAVRLHARDLERGDIQAASREMRGDDAAHGIAARAELRRRRKELLDRNLRRHRRNRFRHARADPCVPAVGHETPRIGEPVARDPESQPVRERHRHALFRRDANDAVALRRAVALLERQPVVAMRRQEGDVGADGAHRAAVLVDAEDQAPRRRQEKADEQVRRAGHAGEPEERCGKSGNGPRAVRYARVLPDGLPGCRVTGLPGCRVAGLPG